VVLIIAGLATLLYIFFSDMAEGIGEASPFLDPAVVLSFVTFVAAVGYILELVTNWNSGVILVIALAAAFVLDLLLYFFVLRPLKSAEVSLAYTDESLQGRVGKVIVPVPVDGFGEIVIETVNGLISKRASGYENTEIEYGKEVLIIEVKDGTFIVKEYEPFRFK
jgi:membrane protein implicated in regulation of membrane protease activity